MAEAYNMAPDLSLFLAVVSVGLSGDPVTGTWSIGSGFTPALPLTTAGGLVSTHNKYEGDASFGRVCPSLIDPVGLRIANQRSRAMLTSTVDESVSLKLAGSSNSMSWDRSTHSRTRPPTPTTTQGGAS